MAINTYYKKKARKKSKIKYQMRDVLELNIRHDLLKKRVD